MGVSECEWYEVGQPDDRVLKISELRLVWIANVVLLGCLTSCAVEGNKMPRLTIELMYQSAIEAVEHLSQANWSGREETAKIFLRAIRNGQTNANLDAIQDEINEA